MREGMRSESGAGGRQGGRKATREEAKQSWPCRRMRF